MTKFDPPPDAFQCPYAKQCWSREAFRWLATVLVTLLTLWLAGCTFSLRGPGVDAGWEWHWPGGATTRPVQS